MPSCGTYPSLQRCRLKTKAEAAIEVQEEEGYDRSEIMIRSLAKKEPKFVKDIVVEVAKKEKKTDPI